MADDIIAETVDSADAAATRNAAKEASAQRRADADVMRAILHTPQGRDWLYRTLQDWHIDGEAFFPGQPDTTAFRLGEQNCAKRLEFQAREASLDLYLRMLKDQKDDQRRLEAVRREERKQREAETAPLTPEDTTPFTLPPPAGFPGGPPMPKPKGS